MKRFLLILLLILLAFSLYAEDGLSSWYTYSKKGALTQSGELFDDNALTGMHESLSFGSIVKVTNLDNGKSIEVKINDRISLLDNRVIYLTERGAKELEFFNIGTARVSLEVLHEAESVDEVVNGDETGWYTIQLGSFSNLKYAYELYTKLLTASLKPAVEIVNDNMLRLSVKYVARYQLDKTLETLLTLGVSEPLVKGEKNPYN